MGAHTRLAGVIGSPIRHSLSPAIFTAAFEATDLDWVYLAFEVEAGEVDDALRGARALGIAGLSVTMPDKEAAARAVDELSEDAAALGAVNSVFPSRAGLRGDNTDGYGFLASLRQDLAFDPAGQRCAVVGAGGAARAVVRALAGAGADTVVVVNRSPDRAGEAAAMAPGIAKVGEMVQVADAALVVNATPLGMGDSQQLAVPTEVLRPGQVVCDLVYWPEETPLVQAATSCGARATNGLGMLVGQAARSFELWTGFDAPVQAMAAAARRALGG